MNNVNKRNKSILKSTVNQACLRELCDTSST